MTDYLPCDITVEGQVLGAMMVSAEAVLKVIDQLTATDFYTIQNRTIYEAIKHVYDRGERVDMLTTIDELRAMGRLDDVGGVSQITLIVGNVVTVGGIESHAAILRRLATYRALIEAGEKIKRLGYAASDTTAPEQAVAILTDAVNVGVAPDAVDIRDTVDLAYNNILRDLDGGLIGQPTGIPDLDKITRGLKASDLVFLAARPSMGKTALALHIAKTTAKAGMGKVAFFSLEMDAAQLTQRLIVSEAGVRPTKGDPQVTAKLQAARDKVANLPILIYEHCKTLTAIKAAVKRMQAKGEVALVVVDYINLMNGDRKGRYQNRNEEIGDISRNLKEFAKQAAVPLLVLAQLNRGAETRMDNRPKMSDLRESGSLEQDADIVALLYRDDYYKAKDEKRDYTCDIIVAKNRNGTTGTVTCMFDPARQLFKGLSRYISDGEKVE